MQQSAVFLEGSSSRCQLSWSPEHPQRSSTVVARVVAPERAEVLGDDEEIVEDWETEWVNDATGASQQVEWFVEDGDYGKESTSKSTS
ncbi:hypothetical protein WJX75_003333 [Coccomyxa subellipsoidea]|uniref:Uncharacterized protein n=1 Tax=Coccomyxa subellipsoidea TaxID=248742 RepID=A0ABR2YP88_9CHLO